MAKYLKWHNTWLVASGYLCKKLNYQSYVIKCQHCTAKKPEAILRGYSTEKIKIYKFAILLFSDSNTHQHRTHEHTRTHVCMYNNDMVPTLI